MAFPTAVLANALAPFLTGRYSLRSPVSGGGWHAEAASVPGNQQDLPDGLAAAMAPFSGGVKPYHRWRVWLPGTVMAAAGWQLTNDTTGTVYVIETDNMPATDQPFTILDVREA